MASSRKIPTNENVSTYDSGGGKDYSTLAGWEEDTDIDLVSATQGETLECYRGAHDDNDTFDGATVSSDYWRCIRPASGEGHSGIGKSDGTVVEFHYSGTMFIADEDYFQFQDLVCKITVDSSSELYCMQLLARYNSAIGCIFYDCTNAGSGKANAIYINDQDVYVINCLFYNIGYGVRTGGWGDQYIYNCTFMKNGAVAVNTSSGATTYIKNCVALPSFYSTGTQPKYRTWSALTRFVDYTNNDFQLDDYGMGCRWRGMDLSADGNYAFDDDILGVSWGTQWDVGCFKNTTATYSSRRKGVNEDIDTYDSAGGKDYSDLGTWESATDVDLDAAETSYVLECYKGYHDDHVSMDGCSGDDGYNRIIRPADGEGHSGLVKTDGTIVAFHYDGSTVFTLADHYHMIQDICAFSDDASSGIHCFLNSYNDWGGMIGCIAFGGSNSNGVGFRTGGNNANKQHYFVNCLSYDAPGDGFATNTEPAAFISCTCYNAGDDGFNAYVTNKDHAYNCCSSNNTNDDWVGTWDDKLSCTTEGATPVYTDAGSDDYSLDSTDTVCRGNGGDYLINEFWPHSDDIKGLTRVTEDIGAFGYFAPEGGIIILRRRMEGC